MHGAARYVIWVKLSMQEDKLSFYRGGLCSLFIFDSWSRRVAASWNIGRSVDTGCTLVMRHWKSFFLNFNLV